MKIFDINTCFGFYPYKNIDTSIDTLATVMNRHNITRACTFSMKGLFYDFSEGNSETLSICKENDNFIPIATINPKSSVDIEEEIDQICSSGFKAIRVFPQEQVWDVEQHSFRKILQILDNYRLPLIIEELPGKLFDITKGIKIPIIFIGTHYYSLHETLAVLSERENFFAETRRFMSPYAVETFVDKLGYHRLVFGSNAPFDYVGSSTERIFQADISEDAKELIMYGNLERMLQDTGGEGI